MQQPVDFCDYIENEVKYGSPDTIPRFCPVPKVKGIYQPTQDQLYKQFVGVNCNVSKKLPGVLGNPRAVSTKMRRSELISANRTKSGTTRFVLNGGANGERQGQPGGITPPVRNRF